MLILKFLEGCHETAIIWNPQHGAMKPQNTPWMVSALVASIVCLLNIIYYPLVNVYITMTETTSSGGTCELRLL